MTGQNQATFAHWTSPISINLLISPPVIWTAPVRCQWSQCLSAWTAQSAQSLSAPYRTSSPEISPMFNVLIRVKHTNRWFQNPNYVLSGSLFALLEVYYRQIMIEHMYARIWNEKFGKKCNMGHFNQVQSEADNKYNLCKNRWPRYYIDFSSR